MFRKLDDLDTVGRQLIAISHRCRLADVMDDRLMAAGWTAASVVDQAERVWRLYSHSCVDTFAFPGEAVASKIGVSV